MAKIIIFPGGTAPPRTALALERHGYRVNPHTGHISAARVPVAINLYRRQRHDHSPAA